MPALRPPELTIDAEQQKLMEEQLAEAANTQLPEVDDEELD